MASPAARTGKSSASHLGRALEQVRAALADVRPGLDVEMLERLSRLEADVGAAAFHVGHVEPTHVDHPILVALLGGTGTGKSTLVNRLCGAPDHGDGALTATSFRRTFTAGPVAVATEASTVPSGWLAVPHETAAGQSLPAQGRADVLVVVEHSSDVTRRATLVDTPDLDGDTPEHHRQADRVFRWCEAVLFVTTPEKYQMTELLAYYRLAERYVVPFLFVMNKTDDIAAADDWQRQLAEVGVAGGAANVFVVPRDDAALTAPPDRDIGSLGESLHNLKCPSKGDRLTGAKARCVDIAGRLQDQVLAPLQQRRRAVDEVRGRLRALVRPEAGVDVHPMTRHLQRRLQQQSVLYLMGPGRVLDRVKSVPSLVARLPRSTWDLLTKGKTDTGEANVPPVPVAAPDFRSELMDGLRLVQSRIADLLTDAKLDAERSDAWKIDPVEAGDIATEELDRLQRWLEERWNAKPRDTRTLEKVFQRIPGVKHLPKVSELAPYLLAAACATTNALVGPVDVAVLSGYSLLVWISERVSNEVAAKTRETNRRISQRFNELSQRQIERATTWAEALAPSADKLSALQDAAETLATDEQR